MPHRLIIRALEANLDKHVVGARVHTLRRLAILKGVIGNERILIGLAIVDLEPVLGELTADVDLLEVECDAERLVLSAEGLRALGDVVGVAEAVVGRIAQRVLRVAEFDVAVGDELLLLFLEGPGRVVEHILETVAHVQFAMGVQDLDITKPGDCNNTMTLFEL